MLSRRLPNPKRMYKTPDPETARVSQWEYALRRARYEIVGDDFVGFFFFSINCGKESRGVVEDKIRKTFGNS